MADANGDGNNNGDGANNGAGTGDTGTGNQEPPKQDAGSQGFDIKSLPEDAWKEIFQHDRFKQLNDKAKQAETLLAEKAEAEKKALAEQGKWKELAEAAEKEVERVKGSSIVSEIKAFAAKLGAVDLNDVAALADKSGVKIDESGNIVGAEEAVKALLESKPHLFNKANAPRVGTGSNPGDANNQGVPKFTHSQIKDPVFWKAHEKDIMAALKAGTVVDDLAK